MYMMFDCLIRTAYVYLHIFFVKIHQDPIPKVQLQSWSKAKALLITSSVQICSHLTFNRMVPKIIFVQFRSTQIATSGDPSVNVSWSTI
jgi:hypothetical protein